MIEASRQHVASTADLTLVWLYWNVGPVTTEDIQKNQKRADYGQRLIEQLSTRSFEILQALPRESGFPAIRSALPGESASSKILQSLSMKYSGQPIWQPLAAKSNTLRILQPAAVKSGNRLVIDFTM